MLGDHSDINFKISKHVSKNNGTGPNDEVRAHMFFIWRHTPIWYPTYAKEDRNLLYLYQKLKTF